MTAGRQKAMEIVEEFRAVMLSPDLDDDDLDYIRDAFLLTIEQEKAFREKFGRKSG